MDDLKNCKETKSKHGLTTKLLATATVASGDDITMRRFGLIIGVNPHRKCWDYVIGRGSIAEEVTRYLK